AFFVAHYQITIHFLHILSHKAQLRGACWIDLRLVAEANRLQRKERFTGSIHWFDFLFKPLGRHDRAKFAICIDEDASASGRSCPENLGDIAAVADIRATSADTNNAVGRRAIVAGLQAERDIAAAGGVASERTVAIGRVLDAGGVAQESLVTVGRVLDAGGVEPKRTVTVGRIVVAGGVSKESSRTIGRVLDAGAVAKQR